MLICRLWWIIDDDRFQLYCSADVAVHFLCRVFNCCLLLYKNLISIKNTCIDHTVAFDSQQRNFCSLFIGHIFSRDRKVSIDIFHCQIGCPAATVPTRGILTTSRRTRLKLSSMISIARGLVASLRISFFQSFRWEWTEDVDFRFTASQISRTEGRKTSIS